MSDSKSKYKPKDVVEDTLGVAGSMVFGTSAISIINTGMVVGVSLWIFFGYILGGSPKPFTWVKNFLKDNLNIQFDKFSKFVSWLNSENFDGNLLYFIIPIVLAALISVNNGTLVSLKEGYFGGNTAHYSVAMFLLLSSIEITGRPFCMYILYAVATSIPPMIACCRKRLSWEAEDWAAWIAGVTLAPFVFMIVIITIVCQVISGDALNPSQIE